MTSKIVEVLARILEDLNIKNASFDEINSKLSKTAEFDKQTLSAAFGLVFDKILDSKISLINKRNSEKQFRVLTEEELDVIGIENYNYLLYLFNVGLITFSDFDLILEQIFVFPGEIITKEDINWVVFMTLIDFTSEIPPGSRMLLHTSDKIN